ncbi:MAG: DNA polymerase IV [Pseudomonadota bacterium]
MRKIIHIDMDAFFASVEQRDNPALYGQPVVVGGRPDSRGVVAAASYEARQFGICSAMPCSQAYRKCPHTIFVKPRFEAYRKVSQQIRQIFAQYSDLIEPLSLDEAYVDVTKNKVEQISATIIAQEIRAKILECTQLTASAGVSYNKFLAKIASDINKPNGIKVILPEQGEAFVAELAIGKFYGIGKVTEEKMKKIGIYTGADLKAKSMHFLNHHFGNSANYFYNVSRGIDNREVKISTGLRKTMSNESTFSSDIDEMDELFKQLSRLAKKIIEDCDKKNIYGRTLTIKVKYADFHQITRSQSFQQVLKDYQQVYSMCKKLLLSTEAGKRKIRLLGVGISSFENKQFKQIQQMTLDLRM